MNNTALYKWQIFDVLNIKWIKNCKNGKILYAENKTLVHFIDWDTGGSNNEKKFKKKKKELIEMIKTLRFIDNDITSKVYCLRSKQYCTYI